MMKFWDKDLFNYAQSKNYLLIPGINNLKDLKEAIDLNCNIIKIYPIKSKDSSINILNYKNIDFIAAGGLSINDLKTYKSLGYKAVELEIKLSKIKNLIQKYMNGSKIIIKDKYNLFNKTTTYLLSHIEHDLEANDQQVLKLP